MDGKLQKVAAIAQIFCAVLAVISLCISRNVQDGGFWQKATFILFFAFLATAGLAFFLYVKLKKQNPASDQDIETDADVEPDPEDLPSIWNVPHKQNRYFTGREGLIKEIHQRLNSDKKTALTQRIAAMGGVGKTEVVREYAYRYRSEYQVVWWVNSEEPEKLASDYAAMAEPLGLKEAGEKEQKIIINAVAGWLEENEDWLLIFDNVENPGDIVPYLPVPPKWHVLVTSRNQDWDDSLPVDLFTPDESLEFLKKRLKKFNEKDAGLLAKGLGYFPLALEQAAAYLNESNLSIEQYLKRLFSNLPGILRGGRPPEDYTHIVDTVWNVTIEKLSDDAIALLTLCSFLAPEKIPLDLIFEGAEETDDLPKALKEMAKDKDRSLRAVKNLTRYSMVTVENDLLSLHRLVQAVVRDRLSADEQRLWAEAALKLVNSGMPGDPQDVRTWPVLESLLPHGLVALEHGEKKSIEIRERGRLLNELGLYYLNRAEYKKAQSFLEQGVEIYSKVSGEESGETAISLNNLGDVLQNLGDLSGAKEYYERALAILKENLGEEHPNVASASNNLGDVLRVQGDFPGAKEHFERALAIWKENLGEEHPNVASASNNLGEVLRAQGDLSEAKEHFERALKIDEKAFGPDHPKVAIRVNNLGSVLQDLGDLSGAKEHYERALTIWKENLGEEHPNVASASNNLGMVLKTQGDLSGAKEYFERALKIDEKAFGRDHPNVAIRVNNLGMVLQDLGDFAGAKENLERALAIFTRFLGEAHPNTLTVKRNLEMVLAEMKKG